MNTLPIKRLSRTSSSCFAAVFLIASCVFLTTCGKDSPTKPTEPEPLAPPAPVPTRITVTPSSVTLNSVGQTVPLTVEVFDQNNAVLGSATVSWSSGHPAVATVSSQGLVTAVSNGTATITARSGSASATAAVTVMQSAGRIVIEPSSATLVSLGETVQLTASVLDDNGQPVSGAVVSWQSSDEGVATVNSLGLVTAVSNGTATITARSGDASSTVAITVMQSAGRIVLEPSSATLMSLGETVQLTASVLDDNGQPVSGAVVSWQSSDEGVATVSSQGLVTAVSNGTATITARSGSASSTVAVMVMQSAGRIVLEPSSATLMSLGETVQLSASVLDANGQAVEGAAISWSSSDEGVATVSSEGLVTAVSNGTATITARSGSASSPAAVTVMQSAYSIVIEPGIATLTAAGETVGLAAAVLDRNEQPVAGVSVSWTSSDPDVATVDDEGLVTALGSGTARITASYNGISATARIEVEISDPDRGTLITLYNALDGPNWTHRTNWLSDLPLGAWHGVEIDDDGRVTRLELADNDLTGSIPPELGNLTNLQELDLSGNWGLPGLWGLSDGIPPELGNLTNLQVLDLSGNWGLPGLWGLSDGIPPELGNLTNLQVLDLGFNGLFGSIPSELGNLSNLYELDLGANRLSGSIPPELGNLGNLQELDLHENPQLSCSIPPELGNLGNLRRLYIFSIPIFLASGMPESDPGSNPLSCSIPPELGNLGNLQELYLTDIGLTGSIPPELGNLGNLQVLSLGFNKLSGSIPPELGNLADLQELDLSNNKLTGSIPPELGNLTNLRRLDLHSEWIIGEDRPISGYNLLSGNIPSSLGNLGNLQELNLAFNELSGSIPPEFGNLGNRNG